MGMEARFAYTVTKHAVVGMTRAMAMDHGRRPACGSIASVLENANALRAGPFAGVSQSAGISEADGCRAPHGALKRLAQPPEIAAAAVYLASDEAAFVTGSANAV